MHALFQYVPNLMYVTYSQLCGMENFHIYSTKKSAQNLLEPKVFPEITKIKYNIPASFYYIIICFKTGTVFESGFIRRHKNPK